MHLIGGSLKPCHVSPRFTALDQHKQEGNIPRMASWLKIRARSECLNLNSHELLTFHLFAVQGRRLGGPGGPGGAGRGGGGAETMPTAGVN